ncbi:DUF5339 family protein [Kingella potus]|nr:DUF5339 family protein [Kingella potus]UOP01449.1 DUF5339 family protein [Kingella potus]
MLNGLSGDVKEAQQKAFDMSKEAMKSLPEDQREAACGESLKALQGTPDSADGEAASEAAQEAKEAASEAAEDAKEAASDAQEAAGASKEQAH